MLKINYLLNCWIRTISFIFFESEASHFEEKLRQKESIFENNI